MDNLNQIELKGLINSDVQALPRILVIPDTWTKISVELDRAWRNGVERFGTPHEALFVPLCGIVHREGKRLAPRLENTALADIYAIVIADVVIPPPELFESSGFRIQFCKSDEGWQFSQGRFDDVIEDAIQRNIRSELLARGHSHPFAKNNTRPSRVDITCHLAPCLDYNQSIGIESGFTFIALRKSESNDWALQGFASQKKNEILNLGFAEFSNNNFEVSKFQTPPFFKTPEGVKQENGFKEAMGDVLKIDRLPFGWSRYRIKSTSEVVLALPPDFPDEPGRIFKKKETAWEACNISNWGEFLPL